MRHHAISRYNLIFFYEVAIITNFADDQSFSPHSQMLILNFTRLQYKLSTSSRLVITKRQTILHSSVRMCRNLYEQHIIRLRQLSATKYHCICHTVAIFKVKFPAQYDRQLHWVPKKVIHSNIQEVFFFL